MVGQRGGIAPFLAAAIPALVAGGKAAAMGGLGTMKALKSLEKNKYKRRRRSKKRQT